MVISAKQFSAETGFPVKLIRRLCRTGQLPHWRSGKVYLLDKDQALTRMQLLKEQIRPPVPAAPVRIRGRSAAKVPEGSTGTERLKALLRKRKTATAATAAVETEGRSGRSGSPVSLIITRKCD